MEYNATLKNELYMKIVNTNKGIATIYLFIKNNELLINNNSVKVLTYLRNYGVIYASYRKSFKTNLISRGIIMTAQVQTQPAGKTFGSANFIFYVAAAGMAAAMKIFYITAGTGQLQFMLKPVSQIVSLFYNTDFFFDSSLGYVGHQLGIAISKSCSGVNYMIIVFLVLVFSYIHYFKTVKSKIIYFAAAFPAAYLITILANTSRIILSIKVLDMGWLYHPFGEEAVHLATGIVTFAGFLILSTLLLSITIRKGRKKNEEFA